MKKYEELFVEYVNDLKEAVKYEMERIDGIKRTNRDKFMTEEELDKYIRNSFDPIYCSGRVIAVFRKYWLECDKLNIKNGSLNNGEYVNPRDLTVDWLSGEYNDLYEIIGSMPYHPIGIDEDGNYC